MGAQRHGLILLPLLAVAFFSGTLGTFAAEAIKNSDCLECHSDKELTGENPAGKTISLFVDETKFIASAHRTNFCSDCHSDLTSKHPDDDIPAKPVNCATCHERQSESYGESVHGLAVTAGKPDSATCADCHGTHEVMSPASPASPLHYSNLAVTCGACHDEAARDVQASVHGKSTASGSRYSATCTDCHSEHKIQHLTGGLATKTSADVCSKCHASERLNTKYNLLPDRVRTFFESYHGLATQYGSTLAANCASCHGYHKILASSDPRSTIHPNNLVATCGKCHPGAGDNFAKSKVHVDPSVSKAGDLGGQINWWVRRLYLWLIFGVIGGMLVHNGLVFIKKVRALRRTQHRPIVRMNYGQRMQHWILMVSFVVLAITGFALKFPDSWIAKILGSNEPFRQWSHRIAGVVMLVAGAYHVFYILATKDGRKLIKDFFPRVRDIKDVFANLLYLVGLRTTKPQFARFGYVEKMEYWAVIWGTIIMGATGLAIWFKMDVTRFFPRWFVDVATTIHYYEAILACLAIIVWHFYHVIFDPEVYPMNLACVDGRVSEHWQEEEHPLEKPIYADGETPSESEVELSDANRVENSIADSSKTVLEK